MRKDKIFRLLQKQNGTNFLIPIFFTAQISLAGGVSDGGGGTLPAFPVTIPQVIEIAEEAKPQLLYLFNGYEWDNRHEQNGNQSLYQKLFRGPRKAQTLLKDLRLEIRADKPCFTLDNKDVDASIYGEKANTICLSAFRIAKKIDIAAAEREILALLMHEISHFVGASEEEAISLQEDIAWSILHAKSKLNEDKLRIEIEAVETLMQRSLSALDQQYHQHLQEAHDHLSNALLRITHWEGETSAWPYRFVGNQESYYQQLLRLKLYWAFNYLASQVPGPDQNKATEKYNAIFKDRNYFQPHEFHWRAEHPYRNEKIFKLESISDLKRILKDLKSEYEMRMTYSFQATSGMRWINLEGHLSPSLKNPWTKYLGTYKVQSSECDTDDGSSKTTEFRIEQKNDVLYLVKTKPGSYSSDSIVIGAYHVNMYLNNYGESSNQSVFMDLEMGGNWSSRNMISMTIKRFELKKVENNFEITETFQSLPNKITQPDFTKICKYKGSVQ